MEVLAALAPDEFDMAMLAAGGTAAVVDGPLPVGDVVLVGAVLGVGGRRAGKVGRILYREATDGMEAFRIYVQDVRKTTGAAEIPPPAHLDHAVRRAMHDAEFGKDGYPLLRR
jgi:hypothetical protein